jgi:hypothetical protein
MLSNKNSFDFIVIGSGVIGTYCAWLLSENGFSVAVIEGKTEKINLNPTSLSHAPIADVMNVTNGGNLDRWGGRISLAGLSSNHPNYTCIIENIKQVSKVFGIANIENNYHYFSNDDGLRELQQKNKERISFFYDNVDNIILEKKPHKNKLVSKNLNLTYTKSLLVCCGNLGNSAIFLRSTNDIADLKYSGHLSGQIGKIKIKNYDEIDYKYIRGGLRQPVLSERDESDTQKSSLLSITNYPFNDPSHGSFALSIIYILLNSKLGSYLLSKPILRRLIVGKVQWKPHLLNILRPSIYDFKFLFSIVFQKFILRRKNPVAILRNKSFWFPLHCHVNLDNDSGSISKKNGQIKVSFENKIHKTDVLMSLIKCQVENLRSDGFDIKLDENFLSKMIVSSVDGYHQMGGIPLSVLHPDGELKKNSSIKFFSTGNLQNSLPHFPTFAALCLVHSKLEEMIDHGVE